MALSAWATSTSAPTPSPAEQRDADARLQLLGVAHADQADLSVRNASEMRSASLIACSVTADFGAHDEELVATDAPHQVIGADHASQPLGDEPSAARRQRRVPPGR